MIDIGYYNGVMGPVEEIKIPIKEITISTIRFRNICSAVSPMFLETSSGVSNR